MDIRKVGLEALSNKYPGLDISVIGDVLTAHHNNVELADKHLRQVYPSSEAPPAAAANPPEARPAGESTESSDLRELKQMTGLSDTLILGAYLQQNKDVMVRHSFLTNQ